MNIEFLETLKKLKLKREYFIFALLYGGTTLIIPLTVQYLVNNLILSGIWQNTISFTIIIAVGLILSQIFRYSLIILSEYIEREMILLVTPEWNVRPVKTPYYFLELFNGTKSFSKTFADFTDIALSLIFGMITVILFHPGFILLPILIITGLKLIWNKNKFAIKTSILESDRKYDLLDVLPNDTELKYTERFLEDRHTHFSVIKFNTIIVGILFVLAHLILIGLGIYFVQTDSLSLGQLVSAEIILSGIFASLIKLPKSMESLYDFETSHYKMKKALEQSI
ncbi:ABC transporter ATP-binding protein [Peredibacter starrii]|uniref:ABC transmembrane type-1 domain-containing protein n=1 Tax=Peredibacter starrii TaxID=28202 RepID=A0AAX4HTJ0_9BACT|nr:hypothetical protein [Peredibacter starrii]WPU66551.1 hypothetical protein SOO65_07315 [Peredibacter starrii]